MQEPLQEHVANNGGDLLKALTAVYQQISTMKISTGEMGLLEALNSPSIDPSTTAFSQIHHFARDLNDILVKDSHFPGNSVRLIRGDSGSSGFYPHFVVNSLVQKALQTGSPETAIEWLQKILSTRTATGKTIHALWGVTVAGEIQLTPQIKIVPMAMLPESPQKKLLSNDSYFRTNSLIVTTLDYEQPKSALTVDRKIEPFIYDPNEHPALTNEEFHRIHELLMEVTLVLTVVGPRVPISAAQWFTFDDPDLNQVSLTSAARRSQTHEILPSSNTEYPVLDPVEASEIVQAYLAIQSNTRNKIRVVLKRLNQAQRRHNVGDRAVEISIALEALLGDDGNTEMTHKIKMRSVRLLGGSNEVRQKNASIIGKTYNIRSKLVHMGIADATRSETVCGQEMSASDIINHAIKMCSELTKIIIRRGSIPDWKDFDITEQVQSI